MKTEEIDDLLHRAREAVQYAHPKLSGYRVGAAVLATDGTITIGYNVETDIHHAIHAEMSAIHAMLAKSTSQKIYAIAVACEDRAWYPCGWCRQWIWEYADGPHTLVFACDTKSRDYLVNKIGTLLPDAFRLEVTP
jgi:cytidine deaminase